MGSLEFEVFGVALGSLRFGIVGVWSLWVLELKSLGFGVIGFGVIGVQVLFWGFGVIGV